MVISGRKLILTMLDVVSSLFLSLSPAQLRFGVKFILTFILDERMEFAAAAGVGVEEAAANQDIAYEVS